MRQNEFVDKIIQTTLDFAPNAKALMAALSFIQEITLQDQATVRLKVLEKIPSEEKEPTTSVEEVKNRFDKILDDYCPQVGKKKTILDIPLDFVNPSELETSISEKVAAQAEAEEKRASKDELISAAILKLMEDRDIRWSGRFTKKDMERLEVPTAAVKAVASYRSGPPIPFLKKSFLILKRAGKRAVWEFEFSV